VGVVVGSESDEPLHAARTQASIAVTANRGCLDLDMMCDRIAASRGRP
jgi:hypothetical protein